MSNDNTNAGERPPRCRVFFKLLSAAVSKYKIAPPQPNSEVPASKATPARQRAFCFARLVMNEDDNRAFANLSRPARIGAR